MKSWVWLGIVLGGLLSALSWFGNVRRDLPHQISVFPDVITLAALPVLVFLALWLVAHRYEASTRATMRRAGMIIVGIGARCLPLPQLPRLIRLGSYRCG